MTTPAPVIPAPPPSPPSRYADLPGLRMHYVELGPPEGAPVILLHGFPEFWYSWRYQLPALAAAGYRVIAPDQRGYGFSDKTPSYDLATLVGDVANLQSALGLSASAIVGHDWGGVVAYAFAARFPQRTRKLAVLNAPHMNAYLDALRGLSPQLWRSWYVYFFQLPWLPEATLRRHNFRALRQAFSQLPAERMSAADLDRYVAAWAQPGALSAMLGWYRRAGRASFRSGMKADRQEIRVPTCVIWGERDTALAPDCNATLSRYVADLQMHSLPQASHWVQMHEPEEVNRLLLAFL